MYMVYRISYDKAEIASGANIIAIYARKGGAINRLETLAHANKGTTYGIAILPEGARPTFENVKEVYAVMIVSPTRSEMVERANERPFSDPSPDDMPF